MSILSKTLQAANPRRWQLYRARPSALFMALLTVFGNSIGMAYAQNTIVPKGTTATQLTVTGNVTNITTGTIHGKTALNAFNLFQVGQNNTVNLVVPTNATHLVNLVTNAPVQVNGIVNSLKDGRIGGNVVFADPYGMIVGASGALNVGSLLVTTPSRQFLDGVIGTDGSIDALAVSTLVSGNAPASGLGAIRIDGQVNARDMIRLQGAAVFINGALRAGAEVAHQSAFLGAVNSTGIDAGVALVETAGVIEIQASGSVALALPSRSTARPAWPARSPCARTRILTSRAGRWCRRAAWVWTPTAATSSCSRRTMPRWRAAPPSTRVPAPPATAAFSSSAPRRIWRFAAASWPQARSAA
ncbi:leukotoxin LktA family filamentous adhesin [Massilia sp. TWP1-3-3]|uniref:leukotoxin LktA family filamentous adhesin n=1 Tax=Massilia sp. TWP1-3-3 TaxID=2804573 RepID=UPI003CED0732